MTKIPDAEPSRERPRPDTYFDNEGGMFFVNDNFLEYFDVFRHRWTVIAHRPIKLPSIRGGNQQLHKRRPPSGASLLRVREETPAIGG